MAKPQNKPSAQQAEEFDEWIRYWQQVLNLMDWRIERSSKPIKAAMAAMECDSQARLGTYQLGDFGSTPIDTESISMTALHECLHVFLFDLIAVAQDRQATPEQLDSVEHRVINVLERVLYAQASSKR
jgi:hypothetical protein